MNKEIKSKGTQVFSIPNNKFGHNFVMRLRSFLNPKYRIRIIPTDKSGWFAIYIDGYGSKQFNEMNSRYLQQRNLANELQKKLNERPVIPAPTSEQEQAIKNLNAHKNELLNANYELTQKVERQQKQIDHLAIHLRDTERAYQSLASAHRIILEDLEKMAKLPSRFPEA